VLLLPTEYKAGWTLEPDGRFGEETDLLPLPNRTTSSQTLSNKKMSKY